MNLQEVYQPGSVLDLPTRPSWTSSMSKEELDRSEQKYFRQNVDRILKGHKDSDDLSYFELNLETWRQVRQRAFSGTDASLSDSL